MLVASSEEMSNVPHNRKRTAFSSVKKNITISASSWDAKFLYTGNSSMDRHSDITKERIDNSSAAELVEPIFVEPIHNKRIG